jgi:hypothetical protein
MYLRLHSLTYVQPCLDLDAILLRSQKQNASFRRRFYQAASYYCLQMLAGQVPPTVKLTVESPAAKVGGVSV